ncbi:prepilin peptidase [Deltaproteobacteria bacterium TL4]
MSAPMWNLLYAMELFFSFVFGAAIGSFMNVCIDRIPLQFLSTEAKKELLHNHQLSDRLKTLVAQGRLNIAHPARSFCFACGYQLKWYENIPIFSFMAGRGTCRQCGIFYGYRSLWIEISTGLGYALIYGLSQGIGSTVFFGFHYSFFIICTLVLWEQRQLSQILRYLFYGIVGLDLFYILGSYLLKFL